MIQISSDKNGTSLMIGIIYKYTSPVGKIYIGQTTEERRRRKTFLNLNKTYGGIKIDRAREKYGPEKFSYEVLEKLRFKNAEEARDKLDELEEFYIRYYDSYKKGYNMTHGGYTTRGFKFSEEQKSEMSKARTGSKLRPRSDEEKAYHSVIMKKHWASKEYRDLRAKINADEEHRRKVSLSLSGEKNGMFGKTHTVESRKKMSDSRTGEKNFWFGKTKSEDYRKKIRQASLDYHKHHEISDATRQKISDSIKVKIKQFSLDDVFIAEYDSPSVAASYIKVDASCIVKCCKGKRKTAGGFHWKYSQTPTYSSKDEKDNEWISTGDAVRLFNRERNVIYYHIKKHGVPTKINGRKLLIHRQSLEKIFR